MLHRYLFYFIFIKMLKFLIFNSVVLMTIYVILRYYYDKNIMTKVHGKRYAYKFDFHGLMTACHQSQPHMAPQPQTGPTATAPVPSTSSSDFGGLYAQQHASTSSPPTAIFPTAPSYWATSAAGLSTLYQHPTGPRYPP